VPCTPGVHMGLYELVTGTFVVSECMSFSSFAYLVCLCERQFDKVLSDWDALCEDDQRWAHDM